MNNYEKEFQSLLTNLSKDTPAFFSNAKNAGNGFSKENVARIESDLLKNFNSYMSNFESAISNINIADYKKIFIDLNVCCKHRKRLLKKLQNWINIHCLLITTFYTLLAIP